MRKIRIRLLLAITVLLALGLGWIGYEDRRLPKYDGRGLRSWFGELCRVTWVFTGIQDGTRELECKRAILEMGPEASPFLVDQVLTNQEEGVFRTALRGVLARLPWSELSWRLVPPGNIQDQALGLLAQSRPSADFVLARVQALRANPKGHPSLPVLALLGTLGDNAEKALPILVEALGPTADAWTRAVASGALRNLGGRALSALDEVSTTLDPKTVSPTLLRWMASLGPAASPAVPGLEGLLDSPNREVRSEAVVALLNIRPDHEGAMRVMRATLRSDAEPTPSDVLLEEQLAAAWVMAPKRAHAEVGGCLEPMAREEIQRWAPGVAKYHATRAMERVAPERLAAMLREALGGPGWVHAATGLLRLDRNDDLATRRLVEAIRADPNGAHEAVLALREAGSGNTQAMLVLREYSGRASVIEDPASELSVRNAAYALARVRYREKLASMGIEEIGW